MVWTKEEVEFLKNNYLTMTYDMLADELHKSKRQVQYKIGSLRKHGVDLPTHTKRYIYAFYERGNKFVMSGTIEEISKVTGIKENNLKFYATPSYINRTKNARRLVRIEGEYDFNFIDEE